MSRLDERTGALDRFGTALYPVPEAARYLDVPASTLTTWTHGYRRRRVGRREVVGVPVLTALPKSSLRSPSIPFIGLAEGLVLTAMRRSGVPLQRIRPALARLEEQFGLQHAVRRVTARSPSGHQRWQRVVASLRCCPVLSSTST